MKKRELITIIFASMLVSACASYPDCNCQCPTSGMGGNMAAPQEGNTKGVYEPFATDNVVPYPADNDEDYYPLYYYY